MTEFPVQNIFTDGWDW